MATGTSGSTFIDELNRIANGGTYPLRTSYLDAQGAANAINGSTGLGLIAALNLKVDPTRQPYQYRMINDVCNELAGTTGLSATDALRSYNI